jgi:hypothetical protein
MSRYDAREKSREPGPVIVQVTEIPVEVTRGGFLMIDLTLQIDGQDKPFSKGYFPNQLAGMFKALDFKEVEPGIYDGDIKKAYGRSFQAELYYETYDKNDGTKGKARRLRNFCKVPLGHGTETKAADIAWEE